MLITLSNTADDLLTLINNKIQELHDKRNVLTHSYHSASDDRKKNIMRRINHYEDKIAWFAEQRIMVNVWGALPTIQLRLYRELGLPVEFPKFN